MSWSDRLQGLRNGSLPFAATTTGPWGKLLRMVSPRATPRPARVQRFEPRGLVSPDFLDTPPPSPQGDSPGLRPSLRDLAGTASTGPSTTGSARTSPNNTQRRFITSRIHATRSFEVGERIADALEIECILNRGRFFDTYVARHLAWETNLVVKIPQSRLLASEGSVQTIAEAASRWTDLGLHPHILYCYALEALDGVPLLLLEHARGGNLRSWLDGGLTIDLRLGLSVGIQLCHALEHVHANGFWHGAVTPENVLFAANGTLLLSDPGVAVGCRRFPGDVVERESHDLSQHLAPEQWNDRSVLDAQVDIFSLGICLYKTLCGGVSVGSADDARLDPSESRLRNGTRSPRRLTQLLGACLAWDPAQRPATVVDVRQELCTIYEEELDRPNPHAQLRPTTWRSDGWNNQALVACWRGNFEEVHTAWSNALHGAPGHIESTFNQALTRWRQGEITDEAALGDLERLLDAQARPEPVAGLIGLLHLERGDTPSALLYLERAARHAANDEGIARALRQARSEVAAAANRRELNGHDDFVSAVAFHPEGHLILSAGDDCRLLLWDVEQDRPLRTFSGHLERLSALALNGDGSVVVSASDDATLRAWDIRSGACLKTLSTVGAVFSIALSADGRRAVSSSSGTNNFLGVDNTVLQVWDVEKERCLGELTGHTNAAKALALTADGETALSAGDDHTVRVWDVSRLRCRRALEGHRHYVTSVCVTPDGTKALSGSWDQTIRLWDPNSGECLGVFTGTRTIVTCVAISADGRNVISGSWDGSVRLWEVESGRCLRTFVGHSRLVTGVALSTDGRTAVSGSWDGTVRVWDLPRERPVSPLRLSQRR